MVYAEQGCPGKLTGGTIEVHDSRKFTAEQTRRSGFVEWRLESRTSEDGTCTLLADVFIDEKGIEHLDINYLEVNGQAYHGRYDKPRFPGDEDEL